MGRSLKQHGSSLVSSQEIGHFEMQQVPLPFEDIDARNGWTDRGNPLNAFDDTERVSLVADEFARLLQWFLVGGSTRNEAGNGPVNQRFKERYRPRQLRNALKRPSMIGFRVVAMLLRLRPDLLEGKSAAQLARSMRISPRAMAHYTISFGQNFPAASKSIRRVSRLVSEEAIRQRHK